MLTGHVKFASLAQRDLVGRLQEPAAGTGPVLPVLRRLDRPRRPLRLPASFQPLMSEAAARDMEAIAAAGCHIHGDLDELLPGSEAFARRAGSSSPGATGRHYERGHRRSRHNGANSAPGSKGHLKPGRSARYGPLTIMSLLAGPDPLTGRRRRLGPRRAEFSRRVDHRLDLRAGISGNVRPGPGEPGTGSGRPRCSRNPWPPTPS